MRTASGQEPGEKSGVAGRGTMGIRILGGSAMKSPTRLPGTPHNILRAQ